MSGSDPDQIFVSKQCISAVKKVHNALESVVGIAKAIFFYFLVYGSSDPNFCILEKN